MLGVWLEFVVMFELDEDGYCVASVPELAECYTQVKTFDELMKRSREAIKAYVEVEGRFLLKLTS